MWWYYSTGAFGVLVAFIASVMTGLIYYERVAYGHREPEQRTKRALGSFAYLSKGTTHYYLKRATPPRKCNSKSQDNPLVVFLHGMTIASDMWVPLGSLLSENGFDALSLDFYGRGFSDSPLAVYSDKLFVKQVEELLAYLKMQTRQLIVIGFSMGGGVACSLAASPGVQEQVEALVLIDAVGFSVNFPPLSFLLGVPILSEFLLVLLKYAYLFLPQVLRARLNELFPGKFSLLVDKPGFAYSYVSTLQHFPFEGLKQKITHIGERGSPVLLIWGENDPLVPFEPNVTAFRKAIPTAEVQIFNGTHACIFEHPVEVNAAILGFLQKLRTCL